MAALTFLSNLVLGWTELVCLNNGTILIKDQREIGVAGAVTLGMRTGISAIATVVFGTVLTNRITSNIPAYVAPALVEAGLPMSSVSGFLTDLSADSFKDVPGVTQSIITAGVAASKHAHVALFRTVYLVSIIFGGLGIITAGFTPDTDKYLNRKIAAVVRIDEVLAHKKIDPALDEA